ncbi:YcaO-like family protein [Enterobacter vonholyi]
MIKKQTYYFKSKKLDSEKNFNFGGSNRSKSAIDTLNDIKPLFDYAGITRLADITRLDRIGIPVTLAIRPNSRTLAVSSGKGLDLESALVSGAMEALELFHSEYSRLDVFSMPYEELGKLYNSIPCELLPLKNGSLFNPEWPETWTLGWDIINDEEVAIPIQLASMAPNLYTTKIPSIASFVTDSNGLASGNNITESILSGLYEVIERDAIALHKCLSEAHGMLINEVEIESIPYETVQSLCSKIQSAFCDIFIYDCTSDLTIPVYKAVLLDNNGGCISVVEGFGCNINREIALIRAITEACQGRVVVISGARDDVYNFSIEKLRGKNFSNEFRNILSGESKKFTNSNFNEQDNLGDDIKYIIERLLHNAIKQVIVVELNMFPCLQSFTKIIIPGLEGYPSHGYVYGKRAKEALSKVSLNSLSNRDVLQPLHLPAGGR